MLAKVESGELEILNKYLPRQLSEEEIYQVIHKTIAKHGTDIAKIIRLVKEIIGAGAERKVIVRLVKKTLNN